MKTAIESRHETGQNLFNLDAYVRDVQGNPLKRIPKQKATVYGSYEIPTANGMLVVERDLQLHRRIRVISLSTGDRPCAVAQADRSQRELEG